MQQPPFPPSMQTVCSVVPPDPGHCERIAFLTGQLGYPCTAEQIGIRLTEMEDLGECVYVAQLPPRARLPVGLVRISFGLSSWIAMSRSAVWSSMSKSGHVGSGRHC